MYCKKYGITENVVFGLVYCGLMAHSVIFQLYSDRTVVKSPNLDLLSAPYAIGNLGFFMCRVYPDTGPGHPKMSLIFLPSEDPHTMRVRRESSLNLLINSLTCYIYKMYATAVGHKMSYRYMDRHETAETSGPFHETSYDRNFS